MEKQQWKDVFNLLKFSKKIAIVIPEGSDPVIKLNAIALWRHLYENTSANIIILGEKLKGKYNFLNDYGVIEELNEDKLKERKIIIVGNKFKNHSNLLNQNELIFFYPKVEQESLFKVEYHNKSLTEMLWEFTDIYEIALSHSFKDLIHVAIFIETNNFKNKHSDRIKDIYKKTSMNHVYLISKLIK